MNCAFVPLTWGNERESCSRPSCASVPGIENELSVPCCRTAAPPPAAARMISQATSTRHGWRNDQRPSDDRSVDTGSSEKQAWETGYRDASDTQMYPTILRVAKTVRRM